MRLKDKVVLVTASTRGIGLAIVQACAKEGAIVYMAARDLEVAADRAKELKGQGFNVKTVYNDATEHETHISMIDEVIKNEGRIDVLVNNFGRSNPRVDRDVANMEHDVFMEAIGTNLTSVYIPSKNVIEHMAKNGGGSIINISSLISVVPDVFGTGYGTGKAAINYLTKALAVQYARQNIRCNAVLPGMTATDAVKNNLTDEFMENQLKHTPIKRMGEPEEMAAAVVYFASDESAYTTGQILEVSGGFGLAAPTFGDNMQEK